MNATVTLFAPIIGPDGKEVASLSFRKPTGADIRACGAPVDSVQGVDEATLNRLNTESIAQYIVRLAGIPMQSVNAMSPQDFFACANVVSGFFQPAKPETSSTGAGNSPGSSQASTPSR
jgi:hypothetical protein